MSTDSDHGTGRRIPTLVQYCQRVASNHVDSISSLGDLRCDLIKPILQGCSPETLVRLEEVSPHIQDETSEIWRQICFRKHPVQSNERYVDEEPESWRDTFILLEEEQARRLEEVGSRIRCQRREAEERKKESQVKLTDRIPPAKRARPWGTPSQPKTLFQKARSSAARIQKSIYGARMIPPAPPIKSYRTLTPSTSSLLPLPPSTSTSPRVIVKAVRRPSASAISSSLSTAAASSTSSSRPVPAPPAVSPPPTQSSLPPRPEIIRPLKPSGKKDPMSNLFMPKHRAHSQLPRQPMATPVNNR